MPRPRKVVQIKLANDNGTSSSSSSSECVESRAFKILSIWKTGVGVACFIIAVYVGTLGYLETRVNTPFDDEKIIGPTDSGIYVPERYWGSYRPGNYFGMKTRDPRSPVMGLMWYEPTTGHKGIRSVIHSRATKSTQALTAQTYINTSKIMNRNNKNDMSFKSLRCQL
ncbi:unnamed protein product [Plutella xylostella]|uniref:Mannosyl-oligosaccharide glucosidase n=1 Tax=Plutella xylostella TaxID=51655 RepID=A0A8S4G6B4_PLUXY|nr:unnamed protein product [Plutella xylostella]